MNDEPTGDGPVTVRLVPRRLERFNAFRHLVAGLTLVMGAANQFGAGHVTPIGAFVLLAGIGLAGVVVVELKRPHLIHGRQVGLVDLSAAVAELAHAAELAELGKVRLPLAYVCIGLVYLSFALYGSKLSGRRGGPRYIRLDRDGVTIRFNPLRRVVLPWHDVRRVGLDGSVFTVHTSAAQPYRVDLDRMVHADAHRATLTAALARFAPLLTDSEPT